MAVSWVGDVDMGEELATGLVGEYECAYEWVG